LQAGDAAEAQQRAEGGRLGARLDAVVGVRHAHQTDPAEQQEGGAAEQQQAADELQQ
jgi:hypothetical protein